MLVSITTTTPDATDLGFLLHKHPDRVRSVDVTAGRAHVFYPEVSTERCTATLLVEIDPIKLSRKRAGKSASVNLEPYVNDRPYVASSMLSGAIGRLFGTALSGTCDNKPELVEMPRDLEIDVPVVTARGGIELVQRLFEPLGWETTCRPLPLDEAFASWGDSEYVSLQLTGRQTVQAALSHLYVLLPVLDNRKHHWIAEDEIDKLLRRGGDWLASHPERELISRRYLRFGTFARDALARLNDGVHDSDAADIRHADGEAQLEQALSLNDQRHEAVMRAVVRLGGGALVDCGCGEGRLLARLVAEPSVSRVLGTDVSITALDRAERRLRLDEMSERRREQVSLQQGALTYTDERLRGYDIATCIEVIEHLDAERLDVFARVLFGDARPNAVVITTPNREYNVHFERLPAGEFRHRDHRFEWDRDQFDMWARTVCDDYGYAVEFEPIGPEDPVTGPPTQMAVFRAVAQ